jgi:PadR family transcriptional regulator, regulatory protein PadR
MGNPSLTARGALLLGLLRGPAYGLELLKRLEKLTDGRVKLQQAAVYPTLRSMEEEGLLRSWEGDPIPERGGRPRRYYELTAKGKEVAMGEHRALHNLLQDAAGGEVAGEVAHV